MSCFHLLMGDLLTWKIEYAGWVVDEKVVEGEREKKKTKTKAKLLYILYRERMIEPVQVNTSLLFLSCREWHHTSYIHALILHWCEHHMGPIPIFSCARNFSVSIPYRYSTDTLPDVLFPNACIHLVAFQGQSPYSRHESGCVVQKDRQRREKNSSR